MVKARKYVVKNSFQGVPKKSDYEVVEYELPPLKDDEILIKAEWCSVDPYLRAYNVKIPAPYDQFGFQVGTVQESKNPEYPVGTKVVSHKGWCTHAVFNPKSELDWIDFAYKLPDLGELSTSLGIGAIGMTGISAYFGFLEICQPKSGETVVVTGAAGAVGSVVGQIAKLKGCKVIGFTGADHKCNWLEKELGFDKALNYKKVDAQKALKDAAPNGIDCYFDNVGGELSSIIISQMNTFGRVSVCGSISSYNEDPSNMPKATLLQPCISLKQLKMEGFLVNRWIDRWHDEAIPTLLNWVKSGQIKAQEYVTEGFDNLFDAFIGMLAGENTGKALVKV